MLRSKRDDEARFGRDEALKLAPEKERKRFVPEENEALNLFPALVFFRVLYEAYMFRKRCSAPISAVPVFGVL